MRVLLVWPKARTDPEWGGDLGAIAEPLALEYLAAGLRLAGHQPQVLDLRLHPEGLHAAIEEFEADVVGVTAFSMHVRAALGICRTVKSLRPSCVTIAGGHHATFLPEDFFEPWVDFVVSGEGVGPLQQILASLPEGEGGSPIPGVSERVDGDWKSCPPGEFDVDALPFPDRGVTAADRSAYFIDWMQPVALLRTSVGCPYRCSFCSLWQLMGGRYLMRRIEDVVTELASIEEEYVFLIDDEAFIHRRRMSELAAAIERSGVRKRLFAYCRIDTLIRNRDVIAAWQEIGLERLFVGIDAISPKDLEEYHKKLQLAQIEEGLEIARELGVEVLAQFVVNTDYTPDDFKRLARFAEHHGIRYPSFTVLTPLPGTDLLRNFDSVVVRQPNGRPDWDFFDTQNAVTATRLPADEFHRRYRDLYRRFKGSYSEHYRHHAQPPGAGASQGAPDPDLAVGEMSDPNTIDLRVDEAEPRLVAVPVQLWETPDGAILKRGCMTLQISGEYSRETVQLVLALADGDGLTREQLLLSVSETAREPVGELVDELLLRRLLIEEGEASSAPEGPLDVYYWHFGARAADVAARIGEAGLTLLGVNAISRRIAAALGASGVHAAEVVDQPSLRNPGLAERGLDALDWDGVERVVAYEEWLERVADPDQRHPLVVASAETGSQRLLRSVNKLCVRRDVWFFPVLLQDLIGYVGPLVVPGRTACFECLRARQNACMDAPGVQRAAEGDSAKALAYHPSMPSILGDVAALEITKLLGGVPPPQHSRLIEVNLLAPAIETRTVLKLPRCPVCGALETRPSVSTKRRAFQPQPPRDAAT